MANSRLALALVLGTLGCAQPRQTTPHTVPQTSIRWTGTWTWKQGPESLTLRLLQDGTTLTGTHSAIGQRGAKVDGIEENSAEPSIKGDIQGAIAHVQFRTGFPDATGRGTATLTLKNGQMYWQIVKSEDEHYFPKSARLSRAK